jgi:hypothetical protein
MAIASDIELQQFVAALLPTIPIPIPKPQTLADMDSIPLEELLPFASSVPMYSHLVANDELICKLWLCLT